MTTLPTTQGVCLALFCDPLDARRFLMMVIPLLFSFWLCRLGIKATNRSFTDPLAPSKRGLGHSIFKCFNGWLPGDRTIGNPPILTWNEGRQQVSEYTDQISTQLRTIALGLIAFALAAIIKLPELAKALQSENTLFCLLLIFAYAFLSLVADYIHYMVGTLKTQEVMVHAGHAASFTPSGASGAIPSLESKRVLPDWVSGDEFRWVRAWFWWKQGLLWLAIFYFIWLILFVICLPLEKRHALLVRPDASISLSTNSIAILTNGFDQSLARAVTNLTLIRKSQPAVSNGPAEKLSPSPADPPPAPRRPAKLLFH